MNEKITLEKIIQAAVDKNIKYIKTGEGEIQLLNVKEITDILKESEEITDAKA